MVRKPKAGYVLGLLSALFVVAVQACNEQMPTTPDTVVTAPPSPADLNLGSTLNGLVTAAACTVQSIVADIGMEGGTISLCGSSLVVPPHSLLRLTHIELVPVAGHPGAVQFYPEGLQFAPSAKPTLTLSTDGVGNPPNAYIVYTDDQGHVQEVETTTSRTPHSVSAMIGHFSRYAVAW